MASSRSRRAAKVDKHADILDQIGSIRQGEKRRADVYSVKDDGDVYDIVTEEQYSSIVAERRAGQDFVVDDGGDYGYVDDGEEEDWGEGGKKKEQTVSKVAKQTKKQKTAAMIKPRNKVSSMFLGSRSGKVVGPGSSSNVNDDEEPVNDDDLLKNLLLGLDDANENEVVTTSSTQSMKKVAIFGHASQLTEMEYVEDEESDELYMPAVAPHQSTVKDAHVVTNLNTLFENETDDNFSPDLPLHESESQSHSQKSSASVAAAPTTTTTAATAPAPPTTKLSLDSSSTSVSVAQPPPPSNVAQAKQSNVTEMKQSNVAASAPVNDDLTGGSDWFAISLSLRAQQPPTASDNSTDESTPTLKLDKDTLQFYWYDIHEEPQFFPGTLFIFGKLQLAGGEIVSACVRVNNVERNMFVLPRKFVLDDPQNPKSITDREVKMPDVYNEVKALLKECGVEKFKAKPVKRKFCFNRDSILRDDKDDALDLRSFEDPEDGVLPESTYLKTVYSFKGRAPPRDVTGRTFATIFGVKSSAKELFVLKRNLMGPGWLDIANFKEVDASQRLSHCKFEFEVDCVKSVKVIADQPPPPVFSTLSLQVQTILNPQTERNEIVLVSGVLHRAVNVDGPTENEKQLEFFSVVRNLPGNSWPFDFKSAIQKKNLQVQITPNERALLGLVMAKIFKYDPDVIVGHGIHGIQLELLLHRMHALKVGAWSKLGRLKKTKMPNLQKPGSSFSLAKSGIIAGRLLCDIDTSAKELLVHQQNYSLNHLSKTQLNVVRRSIEVSKVPMLFNSTKELTHLIGLNENDAYLSLMLMFKLVVLPLTVQLTTLCGNLWHRSLLSERAERVDFLLLHEFHRLKYIVPEVYTGKERREKEMDKKKAKGEDVSDGNSKKRKKAAYAGGLVLEPKRGFYDKFVLLLDFNSLYPSIIQEFNICFTTIKHWKTHEVGGVADLPEHTAEKGQLPKVMYRLLERRRAVKKIMKTERNPVKKEQQEIRQKALKLVANSMYGCLGFSSSRFYCAPLAALITSQGREILQSTVELSNSLGHNVIYGDTDSIMVHTNELDLSRVREIGKQIKKEVNKRFKILEIEIDGIYQKMLLLRKKKYAALSLTEHPDGSITVAKEMKGIDVIRRDRANITREVGSYVIDQILSSKSREEVIEAIHNKLVQTKELARAGKLPLEMYITTKGLTKNPEDYPDKQNQAHVMVAFEMIKAGQTVRAGDHIPYVICEGDGNIAERSHSIEHFQKSNGELKIDVSWYLSNSLLPVIARICDVIEETNAARLADCLGLDSSKFQNFEKGDTEAVDEEDLLIGAQDDSEKYKECEKLMVECPCCKKEFEFFCLKNVEDMKASGEKNEVTATSGLACPTVGCKGPLESPGNEAQETLFVVLANKLSLRLRHFVDRYYQGWYKCSEHPACANRTRQMSVKDDQCWGCSGKMIKEYSARELYMQICYYQALFDIKRATEKLYRLNVRRRADPSLGPQILVDVPEDHRQVFTKMHGFLEGKLAQSAYHFVSLDSVFSFAKKS